MNATFHDLQDKHNSINGSGIRNKQELETLWQSFKERQPFFFELVCENGTTLLIGYGPDSGCVQHSTSDGEPPYLMAANNETMEDEPFVNFLAGNTATPIPRRFCLPIDRVKDIVQTFLMDGTRSSAVDWDAI